MSGAPEGLLRLRVATAHMPVAAQSETLTTDVYSAADVDRLVTDLRACHAADMTRLLHEKEQEIARLRERLARFEQQQGLSFTVVRNLLTLVDRLSGSKPDQSFSEVITALAYLRGEPLPEVTP